MPLLCKIRTSFGRYTRYIDDMLVFKCKPLEKQSCLQECSCLIYVICVCLRIVVSNTYCCVFLLLFFSCVLYVASFSGFSIFYGPFSILQRLSIIQRSRCINDLFCSLVVNKYESVVSFVFKHPKKCLETKNKWCLKSLITYDTILTSHVA